MRLSIVQVRHRRAGAQYPPGTLHKFSEGGAMTTILFMFKFCLLERKTSTARVEAATKTLAPPQLLGGAKGWMSGLSSGQSLQPYVETATPWSAPVTTGGEAAMMEGPERRLKISLLHRILSCVVNAEFERIAVLLSQSRQVLA